MNPYGGPAAAGYGMVDMQNAPGAQSSPMINNMLLNALGRQAGCTGGSGLMNVLQNA